MSDIDPNGQDEMKKLKMWFWILAVVFAIAFIFVQFQIWVLHKYDAEFAEWVIDTYEWDHDGPMNPEVPNYPW